jgi:hypothetical protein
LASLFCIIIYYYSLIYFIFRDATYVVSSVFTCLMIIGGFAAGVRILLEKDCPDTIFRKIRKNPEKYQEIMFRQKTEAARRRKREEPQGRLTHRGAAQPLVALACCVALPAHFSHHPFAYIIVPENLSERGAQR